MIFLCLSSIIFIFIFNLYNISNYIIYFISVTNNLYYILLFTNKILIKKISIYFIIIISF